MVQWGGTPDLAYVLELLILFIRKCNNEFHIGEYNF